MRRIALIGLAIALTLIVIGSMASEAAKPEPMTLEGTSWYVFLLRIDLENHGVSYWITNFSFQDGLLNAEGLGTGPYVEQASRIIVRWLATIEQDELYWDFTGYAHSKGLVGIIDSNDGGFYIFFGMPEI